MEGKNRRRRKEELSAVQQIVKLNHIFIVNFHHKLYDIRGRNSSRFPHSFALKYFQKI
jgi:hypothetical protein